MTIPKTIRAAMGIAMVIALGLVVMNWWGDYRTAGASKSPATTVTTSAPSAVPTVAVAGIGVTNISGVNFRTKPSSSATLIRGLKKGEKVTVILKEGSWYKVKDSKGKTGWVTANGDYVVIQGQ